jgi:hypothetical protein
MSITASAGWGGQCSRLFRSAGHESSARRSRPALRTPTTRTTTPRLGGGVRTSFPKLAGCVRGMATSGVVSMSSFRECCTANIACRRTTRSPTLCTAAMRPLAALSAFLDVSSLNLAVPQAPPFFARRIAREPHVGPGASAMRRASVRTQSFFDYSSRTTSQCHSCAGGRRNPGSRAVFGGGFGSAARRIAYSVRPRFNSPAFAFATVP